MEDHTIVDRVLMSDYVNQSDKFMIPPTSSNNYVQYSHLYFVRLSQMKSRLLTAAKERWGDNVCHCDLKDLIPNKICFTTGTIFKEMNLRPSTLREISDHHHLLPHPPRTKFVTSTDKLLLEDFVQRISLISSGMFHLTTGISVAVKGSVNNTGTFEVTDYCFPVLPPPPPLPSLSDNKYVILVSGLMIGSDWSDQWAIEQLVDYITGQLGGAKDMQEMSKVVRLVIAGNSITNIPKENIKPIVKYSSRGYTAQSVEAMKELDVCLSQLASSIQIDIMPGSYDPTNGQLPHQPLHHCMFPLSSHLNTLKGVSNPYQFSVDGFKFIGTSGENIDNLYCCTDGLDSLELLEKTLEWSHISPTCPDTLNSYPFSKQDPFILEECPHVYFAGNQPHFQTKTHQMGGGHKVLLVSVPTFDIDHTCVLVNLQSMTCQPLSFESCVKSSSSNCKPNVDQTISLTQQLLTQDIDSD